MNRRMQKRQDYLDFDYGRFMRDKSSAEELVQEIIRFGEPEFKLPAYMITTDQEQFTKKETGIQTSQSSFQLKSLQQQKSQLSHNQNIVTSTVFISRPEITLTYKGHQISFALQSAFKNKSQCLWVPCLLNNLQKIYPVKELYRMVVEKDMKKAIKTLLEKHSMPVMNHLKINYHKNYLLFKVQQTQSIEKNIQIVQQSTQTDINKLIKQYKINANHYMEAFNKMVEKSINNIVITYLTEQISNDSSKCQLFIIFKILKSFADKKSDHFFNIRFSLETIEKFQCHLSNAKKYIQVCMNFCQDIEQNFIEDIDEY